LPRTRDQKNQKSIPRNRVMSNARNATMLEYLHCGQYPSSAFYRWRRLAMNPQLGLIGALDANVELRVQRAPISLYSRCGAPV
jgi:hypothetical protein